MVRLDAGPVHGLQPSILETIERFEPIDFEPGQRAAEWLRLNVDTGNLPLDTYLVFDEQLEELLGFFVVELIEVRVARGDVPIMEVRKRIEDASAPQPALKLVWIARSTRSPKGLGQELFDEVLVRALEAGAVAVVVEPYDEATAKKLWEEHFHCRIPRDDSSSAGEWSEYMWYPVGTVDQIWG